MSEVKSLLQAKADYFLEWILNLLIARMTVGNLIHLIIKPLIFVDSGFVNVIS